MKKTLTVVLLVLALLSSGAVTSVAHTAPSAKTTASAVEVAPGIFAVHVASHTTQRTVPRDACSSGTWIREAGQRQSFPQVVLQAVLNVWVASSNHSIYCGYVYAEGDDRLLQNCHTFDGDVNNFSVYNGFQYSYYSVYHCTHTEYTFTGAVSNVACGHDSGWAFQAVTEASDDWQDNYPGQRSPIFPC